MRLLVSVSWRPLRFHPDFAMLRLCCETHHDGAQWEPRRQQLVHRISVSTERKPRGLPSGELARIVSSGPPSTPLRHRSRRRVRRPAKLRSNWS